MPKGIPQRVRCRNLPTHFAIHVRDTTKFNSPRRYSRIVLVTSPRSPIHSSSEVLAKKITELTTTHFVKVVGSFCTRITLETSVDLPKNQRRKCQPQWSQGGTNNHGWASTFPERESSVAACCARRLKGGVRIKNLPLLVLRMR